MRQKLREEINQLELEEHRINDRLSIYDLEIKDFLQRSSENART